MGFDSPHGTEDARILCCWRGNVTVALIWGWCLRVLYNIVWLAFWFGIELFWMVFVVVLPIFILLTVLIAWKLKSRRIYFGILIATLILLVLDSGYLIYLIVSASMSSGALRGYVAKAVARQGWKHGTTTTLLILFAVAQVISILTDVYFIFLTRRILAYLRRVDSAPEDAENRLQNLAQPPRAGKGALSPNTAAKFAKFSSALQDQRASGDDQYTMSHISPQIEFPAGPPSLDSTIPGAPDDYYFDGDVDDNPAGRIRALTNGLETSEVLSKDREFAESSPVQRNPSNLTVENENYKLVEPIPAKTPPRPPKTLNIPKWEQLQYVSDSEGENTPKRPLRPQYLDIDTPGSAAYTHLYDEYKTFDSDIVREVIRKATDASGVASPLARSEGYTTDFDDYGNRASREEQAHYDLSPEALQEYGHSVDIDRPFAYDEKMHVDSPLSPDFHDAAPAFVGFSRTPRQVRHDDASSPINFDRLSIHSRKSLNDTVSFWTQGRASMRDTRSGSSNSAEDEEYSIEDEDEDGHSTDITTSGTPDDDVSLATAGETSDDDDQRSLATLQRSDDGDSGSEAGSNKTMITSSSAGSDELDDNHISKLRHDDDTFDEEMARLKKDLQNVLASTARLSSMSEDGFSTAPTSPAVARLKAPSFPNTPTKVAESENHDSTLLTAASETDYSKHADEPVNVGQSSTVIDAIDQEETHTSDHSTKLFATESAETEHQNATLTRSTEIVTRPYTIDDIDTTLEGGTVLSQANPVSAWAWQPTTTLETNVYQHGDTNSFHHSAETHTETTGIQHATESLVETTKFEENPVATTKIDEEASDTTSKRVTFDFSNVVEQPTATRKSSVSTEEEWKVVEDAHAIKTQPIATTELPALRSEKQMSSQNVLTKAIETVEAPVRESTFSFSSVDEGDPWSVKKYDTVDQFDVVKNEVKNGDSLQKENLSDDDDHWRIVEEGEEVHTTYVPVSQGGLPYTQPLSTLLDDRIETSGNSSHRSESYIIGTSSNAVNTVDSSIAAAHGSQSAGFSSTHQSPPLSTTYSSPYELAPAEHTSSIFNDDPLNWQSSTIAEHHIHLTGSLETIAEESETSANVVPTTTQPPPIGQQSAPLRPPPQIFVSGTHDEYSSSDDDSDQKSLSTLDDAEDSARRRAIKLTRSDSECTERSLSSASGVSSIRGHGKGAIKTASAISDDDSDDAASLSTLETRSQISAIDSDAGDDLSLASASGNSGQTTPTHASDHGHGSRWSTESSHGF